MQRQALSQWCWRCSASLSSGARSAAATSHRPLSTTATLEAPAPKTAKGHQRAGTEPTKGRKTLRIAKKAPPKTGKAPAPGERRAFRKRIVLTNPNAIEVEGLKGLNNDTTVKESSKGTLLVLPEQAVDQLRELAVFKPTQKWRSFRKPAVLWTEQSLELARQLATVEEQQRPGLLRRMLCGEKGVGKSVMLLQAQATALSRGWVVMSIPECRPTVNGDPT